MIIKKGRYFKLIPSEETWCGQYYFQNKDCDIDLSIKTKDWDEKYITSKSLSGRTYFIPKSFIWKEVTKEEMMVVLL